MKTNIKGRELETPICESRSVNIATMDCLGLRRTGTQKKNTQRPGWTGGGVKCIQSMSYKGSNASGRWWAMLHTLNNDGDTRLNWCLAVFNGGCLYSVG